MIFIEFFNHECRHENFPADKDVGYCPDCGELIENQWFMMRCSCCGVKHKAIYKNGKVLPLEKFCSNCGSKEFVVERVDKINFIDINYAVLVKKIMNNKNYNFTQCWVNKTSNCKPRLLQQFR